MIRTEVREIFFSTTSNSLKNLYVMMRVMIEALAAITTLMSKCSNNISGLDQVLNHI
jgi:hypothetical protein